LSITGDVTDENDECDTDIGDATYTDVYQPDFPCSGRTIITRTWRLVDDCNNERIRTQIIVLNDTTPPDFTAPADITLDCSMDYEDLTLTGNYSAVSDNCDGSIGVPAYRDSVVTDATCLSSQTIYRTWSLTDGCGNTNEQLQVISMIDTIAPTFTLPSDVTLSCGQDRTDLNLTGDVTDATDDCIVDMYDPIYLDTEVSSCPGDTVISRQWIVFDRCGNFTTGFQTISIVDTVPPVISFTDTTATAAAGVPPCSCVGAGGGLTRELFNDISGSNLDNLYSDPSYPNNPDETTIMTTTEGPTNIGSNYGTRVRGFIRPSETGDYTFNITGNNHVDLFLSTDHTPENASLIAYHDNYTNTTQHDKYPTQTSASITLQAGEYYYFELTHKESGGSDHFRAFWDTPSG
ncbi:MAG: PA14 domain-containing protein, partial [Bacteroidota bacterium]